MTPAVKAAAAKIRRWRNDPVAFVREEFNVEPDAWQVDFLIAYNENQSVASKACKGPGKTTVLSWCCWHFLATRPHPKIAATSITGDNLRDGLWAEMAKWQQRSAFLREAFTWKAERITSNDHPETWWMSARKWSQSADKEQQANALAGLHADYIMFVVDEAGGVPDAVVSAAKAALSTGIECKLLICGNPTHLSGPLYRACTKERKYWKVIEITGDPDDPKRSPRISIDWARRMIDEYGEDHPWVLVNVFGRFPPMSFNALVGPDDMERAMKRTYPLDTYQGAPKILGVDVARQGDDRTVIAPRQGIVCFKPKILRIPDTQIIAGIVAEAIVSWQPDAVFVDGTGGYGAGVVDGLRQLGHNVIEVQFSGKSADPQFINKRTEMAFVFASAIKKHGLCLPNLPELTEEATAITYFFSKQQGHDKMQILDKDHIKEEIGRSPDLFDAYALTYAHPVAKKDPFEQYRNQQERSGDYDPIRRHYQPTPQQPVDEYNPFR